MDQLETYLEQEMPDICLSQIGSVEVIKPEDFPYLASVLPCKKVSTEGKYAEIPDNKRYKIQIRLAGTEYGEGALSYEARLVELAEKRLTLSYTGSKSPFNNAVYTVSLSPTIKLDGITQVSGTEIGAGENQIVSIDLVMPNQGTETIQNEITAGEFHAFCLTWPSSNGEAMMSMSSRMNQTITDLGDTFLDEDGFIKEDLAGDFLYLRGKSWFTQVGLGKELASSFMHLPFFKDLGFAEVSIEADVEYLFGMPYSMELSGLMIDADRNTCLVMPKEGENWKTKEFMTITGYASSALEHLIWEQKYGPGGISAVKAIQIANEQGIPVHDIDSSNVSLIDTLSISDDAKSAMHNAINAGYVIKTPASNITYADWTGIGYIVQNPATGAGRYEISGGSGGWYHMPLTGTPRGEWALICIENFGAYCFTHPSWLLGMKSAHIKLIAKELAKIGYDIHWGSVINKQILLSSLTKNPYKIFYFCEHGNAKLASSANPANPEEGPFECWIAVRGGYRTAAQQMITAEEVDNAILDIDLTIPGKQTNYKVVFIQACRSASYPCWSDAFGLDKSKFDHRIVEGVEIPASQCFIGYKAANFAQVQTELKEVRKFWQRIGERARIDQASAELPDIMIPVYSNMQGVGSGQPIVEWYEPADVYWNFAP